jgi:hypothetical protein
MVDDDELNVPANLQFRHPKAQPSWAGLDSADRFASSMQQTLGPVDVGPDDPFAALPQLPERTDLRPSVGPAGILPHTRPSGHVPIGTIRSFAAAATRSSSASLGVGRHVVGSNAVNADAPDDAFVGCGCRACSPGACRVFYGRADTDEPGAVESIWQVEETHMPTPNASNACAVKSLSAKCPRNNSAAQKANRLSHGYRVCV